MAQPLDKIPSPPQLQGRSAQTPAVLKAAFSGVPSPGHLVKGVCTGLHTAICPQAGPTSEPHSNDHSCIQKLPSISQVTWRHNWQHWLSSYSFLPSSLRPISTKSVSMSELTWYFLPFGFRADPFFTQLPPSFRLFHDISHILLVRSQTSHNTWASAFLSVGQGYLDQSHMAQASPKECSLSRACLCAHGLGWACGSSALVSLHYHTPSILTPAGTGIYMETLLQNYKAELCNKKIHVWVCFNTQVWENLNVSHLK